MSEILRSDAIRSVSQGVPPRTSASATPLVQDGKDVKDKKKGILKNVTRGKIPPSSPSQERRPVGEITKPSLASHGADYIKRRQSINNNYQ